MNNHVAELQHHGDLKSDTQPLELLKMVNLPAGSGKTTQIHDMITQHCHDYPNDNILAITYTNRAAVELRKGLESQSRVDALTIHSFIERQLIPFFNCPEVVREFFLWKTADIENYVNNPKKVQNVTRYREKIGESPTQASIQRHTKEIRYSRTQFTSLLYPSLGHDDLLSFFVRLAKKYRMFRQRIGDRYQLIVIDEYQDTNPAILDTIADLAEEFSTPLWIYGDSMQQIFNKRETELWSVLNRFTTVKQPIINHRSSPRIVNMLNRLYNDSQYVQNCDVAKFREQNAQDDQGSEMELILSNYPQSTVNSLQAVAQTQKPLALVVFNRERFERCGLSELFTAYSKTNEYGYAREYQPVNVLLPAHYDESPDDLDSYMLQLVHLHNSFKLKQDYEAFHLFSNSNNVSLFGTRLRKDRHGSRPPVFHSDLVKYVQDLKKLTVMFDDSSSTVETLVERAHVLKLIDPQWYKSLIEESDVYDKVHCIPCKQFSQQYDVIRNSGVQYASTQHGVKGEGHNSIIFLTEDSTKHEPRLSMYDCIELISKTDNFNLKYIIDKQWRIHDIAIKYFSSEMPITKESEFIDQFDKDASACVGFAVEIKQLFATQDRLDTLFYDLTISNIIEPFLQKTNGISCPNNVKSKMGTISAVISRIATAYRVFYVGCSRAISQLRIVMDINKLHGHGHDQVDYEQSVVDKFKQFGFTITYDPPKLNCQSST